MSEVGRRHPLDRPAARLVSAGIALAALLALAAIHREDLSSLAPTGPAASRDDPLSRCIAEHHATIAAGVAEGVFKAEQAVLFKQRAEALCRSTVSQ